MNNRSVDKAENLVVAKTRAGQAVEASSVLLRRLDKLQKAWQKSTKIMADHQAKSEKILSDLYESKLKQLLTCTPDEVNSIALLKQIFAHPDYFNWLQKYATKVVDLKKLIFVHQNLPVTIRQSEAGVDYLMTNLKRIRKIQNVIPKEDEREVAFYTVNLLANIFFPPTLGKKFDFVCMDVYLHNIKFYLIGVENTILESLFCKYVARDVTAIVIDYSKFNIPSLYSSHNAFFVGDMSHAKSDRDDRNQAFFRHPKNS